jgi:hypothetical protein
MSTSVGVLLGFLAKVFGLSLAVALAIKLVGPQLGLPATATASLLIVCLPPLLLAAVLLWRLRPPSP